MNDLSYCLIVNKASNSGRSIGIINKHLELINKTLLRVEIFEVDVNESISQIAKSKATDFDVIVACGGDGTARNVAIGLRKSDKIFGVLPLGSGNDFAKMLNLSQSFEENLHILKEANTRSLDLGIVNDTFFINTLGIGFDGHTNYLASKSKIRGALKYVFSGIRALISVKSFYCTIELDQKKKSYETLMIIIANGKWEGGKYFISPNSINNDGILELIIFQSINRIKLMIEFIKLTFGKSMSSNSSKIIPIKKATIHTSIPVFVHADGEIKTAQDSFLIDIKPNILNVIYRSD